MLTVTCEACGTELETVENYLGTLGTQAHFRCRNCGWVFDVPAEEVDLNALNTPDDYDGDEDNDYAQPDGWDQE